MLALGLLLNFAGIGLFCWLIFTLAVYALPFFALCGRPHNSWRSMLALGLSTMVPASSAHPLLPSLPAAQR
jgi:hypothetical protein